MDELIKKYEDMIASIIHKLNYVGSDISYDELMQIGRVAIWKSASKYDPERGAMSTFLYTCIQRDMWKYLDKEMKHRHVSLDILSEKETACDVFVKIQEEILIDVIREKFGDKTDYFIERVLMKNELNDIAERYGVTVKKVQYWSEKIHRYVKEDYFEEKDKGRN